MPESYSIFALSWSSSRSSRRRCSIKKAVLKNFTIFTGKHLCWSLFLTKLQACNFIPKRFFPNRLSTWIFVIHFEVFLPETLLHTFVKKITEICHYEFLYFHAQICTTDMRGETYIGCWIPNLARYEFRITSYYANT